MATDPPDGLPSVFTPDTNSATGRGSIETMHTSAPAPAAPPALKARILRAAGWLVAGNLSGQLLRLISSLLLTRLLVPDAFGLMAAANTVYLGLLMFSDLGIWQSVVRSQRGDDPRFLGTIRMVQLLRGILLALLVLGLAAGLAAARDWFAAGTVYADPRLPPMMAVLALAALAQGLESVHLACAQRELRARLLVRLELITQLTTILLTVLAAWWFRSVWALVLGNLVGAFTKTLLSYWLLPGDRVRFCWDAAGAREILGFGKWIFLSSLIGFLAAQGEKLILGAQLAAATLGLYAIASNLLSAAVGLYGTLNGRVIFPSLSLVLRRNDPAATLRAYTRAQQLADLFLGLSGGLLLAAGHWLVELLYDPRYREAGWMLQILGLGLVAMRHQVLEQLMFALGRSGRVSANNALRALGLISFIPLGFALAGERGAVWGVALSQFASWPLSLEFKYRQGLLNWRTEAWWLPALAAGVLLGLLAGHLARALLQVF
jgi:O-antigen/teichoic acid export membrane protein